MALIESHLDSMRNMSPEEGATSEGESSARRDQPNGAVYGIDGVPGALPLNVDYRSPISHFIPPAVELYASKAQKSEIISSTGSSESSTPVKRKRGRPRIDKTSPEYLAKSAARKEAKERAPAMNSSSEGGEKRKRGRPRIDKTSPEYLARKKAKEIEALEKKAKRQNKRRATGAKLIHKSSPGTAHANKRVTTSHKKSLRKAAQSAKSAQSSAKVAQSGAKNAQSGAKNAQSGAKNAQSAAKSAQTSTKQSVGGKNAPVVSEKNAQGVKTAQNDKTAKKRLKRPVHLVRRRKDSGASSSGETTPRAKRKYTKRPGAAQGPGRPKKDGGSTSQDRVKGKRGRPRKTDLIAAGLLSPGGTTKRSPQEGKIRVRSNLMPINSEPISLDSDDEPDLDENLRALRHIHEKYANLERDDALGTTLLGANSRQGDHIRKQDLQPRVEKLEDSSNSDSGSSSSGSGTSSSSSSSSSNSSSSSDSSSDSDSDSDNENENKKSQNGLPENNGVVPEKTKENEDERSFGAWSYKTNSQSSSDESLSEREGGGAREATPPALSESENESPDKSYQCHICRKWYSTQVTLKIHRRGHQSRAAGGRARARGAGRYSCEQCRQPFARREQLLEHRAEEHRGSVVGRCAVCRRCFEDEAELAAHEAAHSPNERSGKCSECGAHFGSYEQLRRHRAAAHPSLAASQDGGNLSCTQCGKQFSHAHSLQRHQLNHARQLYRCVVCKASFARADQLAQHLNSHLANYKRLKP